MTSDPFASVEQAVSATANEFQRALESTREAWNDGARRAFDAQHSTRLLKASDVVVSNIAAVRASLDRALRMMNET